MLTAEYQQAVYHVPGSIKCTAYIVFCGFLLLRNVVCVIINFVAQYSISLKEINCYPAVIPPWNKCQPRLDDSWEQQSAVGTRNGDVDI